MSLVKPKKKLLLVRLKKPVPNQEEYENSEEICNIICSIWEQLAPYLSFFSKINLHMIRKDLSLALKTAGKIPQPLYVHQVPHFRQILKSVRKYGRAIDTSEPGLGKTYISAFLAYITGKPLIIFGPEVTRTAWEEATEFYGITDYVFYSYGVFQRRTKPIPFIEVDQYGDYQVTQRWLDLVDHGIHLVFDEVHFLRNDSKRNLLASTIAHAALASDKSSVTYLTGSPIEDYKQARPYLRIFGLSPLVDSANTYEELYERTCDLFVESEKLVDISNTNTTDAGSNVITEVVTRSSIPRDQISILTGPVYKYLRHSMEPIERKTKACNYFMDVGDTLDLINSGIDALEDAINQHEAENYITLLVNIECSKSKSYKKLIDRKLSKHPNKKVIIMLNYTKPLKYLTKKLAKYNPIVINGKVKARDRPALIAKFQEPNTKHRLLIANINVIGVGIGLDDIHGEYNRELYISPGNSLTKIMQAMKRIDRGPRTASVPKVKILYADGAEKEMPILARLQEKSVIMKESLGYKTILPSKLPYKYEIPRETAADAEGADAVA